MLQTVLLKFAYIIKIYLYLHRRRNSSNVGTRAEIVRGRRRGANFKLHFKIQGLKN
jgi:hypothetical protein